MTRKSLFYAIPQLYANVANDFINAKICKPSELAYIAQVPIHSAVAPIQINFATRESFNDSDGDIILEFVCDNFTAQEAFEKELDSRIDGYNEIAGNTKY